MGAFPRLVLAADRADLRPVVGYWSARRLSEAGAAGDREADMSFPQFLAILVFIFAVIFIFGGFEDERCTDAGGVRVQTRTGFVCVKPINLEKKP
jgi:hypothetical protein